MDARARVDGFLIIDKPAGITSREAVDRAARWFPRGTRLGHTGTLDPLATGVLVLAAGQGTRLTEYVQRMEKVYRAGVALGGRSDTDDADGRITPVAGAVPPSRAEVEQALAAFVGEIQQTPPAYSAAKVQGRRAYALARRRQEVKLEARPVRIHEIRALDYAYPRLDLEVRCGKGTYIRALARDLGEGLGCGGYIAALRRTRVGAFREDAALPLDADAQAAQDALLELSAAVAELPRVSLLPDQIERFRRGQTAALAAEQPAGEVAVFDESGRFAGIGVILDTDRIQPDKVFM